MLFIGAMGSGQRDVWKKTGGYGFEVNNFRSWLDNKLGDVALESHPVDYPARGTDTLKPAASDLLLAHTNPGLAVVRYRDRVTAYFAGLGDGVNETVARLRSAASCVDQQIVLAGYSQGAMVMHRAVVKLQDQGRKDILRRVAGLVLFGDGDRISDTDTHLVGEPAAGRTGQGIAEAFGSRPDVPKLVRERTWSFCTKNDLVCDFRGAWNLNKNNWKLSETVHKSYYGMLYTRNPAANIAAYIKGKLPPPPPTTTHGIDPQCVVVDTRARAADAPEWIGDLSFELPTLGSGQGNDVTGSFRNRASQATAIDAITVITSPEIKDPPSCAALTWGGSAAASAPPGQVLGLTEFHDRKVGPAYRLYGPESFTCIALAAVWSNGGVAQRSDFSTPECFYRDGATAPPYLVDWEAAWLRSHPNWPHRPRPDGAGRRARHTQR